MRGSSSSPCRRWDAVRAVALAARERSVSVSVPACPLPCAGPGIRPGPEAPAAASTRAVVEVVAVLVDVPAVLAAVPVPGPAASAAAVAIASPPESDFCCVQPLAPLGGAAASGTTGGSAGVAAGTGSGVALGAGTREGPAVATGAADALAAAAVLPARPWFRASTSPVCDPHRYFNAKGYTRIKWGRASNAGNSARFTGTGLYLVPLGLTTALQYTHRRAASAAPGPSRSICG
jgi:hypothetical protein